MNNKGFAITTMLYGTFLVFLMLLFVMLGILNSYKTNMEKLIDGVNGAREIVTWKCSDLGPATGGTYSFGTRTRKSLTEDAFKSLCTLCGYTCST